ncbi:tRNA lysidine(34) synthetase TilS [Candidatus Pelagibacter sp.]|jgi:tRNA(Ile)-lysidine synthase|nr:tRNA lysidine(34) synthetase TilS [Candidatus Pelagibacter sp.]
MSLKNLNANKTPKVLKKKLLNKKINQLYDFFEKEFDIQDKFAVAVSGGPDSLALAFLTKIYSIKNKTDCKYFIVDHKLRVESTKEAIEVKKNLNNLYIKAEILTWNGKKPLKNIQSLARKKRYDLLFSKCNKLKIKNLVLGHHLDDMFENFFIRMIRGSGLKGLVSLDKKTEIKKINLIRPLLKFSKKDLIFISTFVFNFFIKDPSNDDNKYTRIRIRKLINEFKQNGFDKDKFLLTVNNLKKSNKALLFYVEQNKKLNSSYNKNKEELILNKNFFDHPHEVIFRSISDLIKLIGGKYSAARGKKIDHILEQIKNNSFVKVTLGGCVIKKLHQTVIISKEY